jgi:hypothetical protein
MVTPANGQVIVDRTKRIAVSPMRHVLILAPLVDFSKIRITLAKSEQADSPGAAGLVANTLFRTLTELFTLKGIEVSDAAFDSGDPDKDSKTSASSKIEEAFGAFVKQTSPRGEDSYSFRDGAQHYRVERELLEELDHVDIVILTYATGAAYSESSGMTVLEGIAALGGDAGGGASDWLSVHIAVIDTRSGMTMYYLKSDIPGNFIKKPDRMSSPVREGLKPFFRHLALSKESHRRRGL